jgi:hypothetical protein
MAVPSFLAGSFTYTLLSACTDVQAIMDQMSADYVGTLGWTQTVGASGDTTQEFKTPVGDTDAEFFTVNCVRISATDLQILWTDGFVNVFCYPTHSHLNIDAGGTNVGVFGGIGVPYFFISAYRASAGDTVGACQIDRYPDPHGIPIPRWVGWPCRTSTGVLTWNAWDRCIFKTPADTAYNTGANTAWYNTYLPVTGTSMFTYSGAMLARPVEHQGDAFWMGRVPQALMVDDSLAYGAEYNVPIDYDGATFTVGTFKILCLATGSEQKMMVRIA